MNVITNKLATNLLEDNIIKDSNAAGREGGAFANILENALEGQLIFPEKKTDSLSITDDGIIEARNIDLQDDRKERKNYIPYENINYLADIFLFIPNAVRREAADENKNFSIDCDVFEKCLLKDLVNADSPARMEKLKALVVSQTDEAEKLIFETGSEPEPKVMGGQQEINSASDLQEIKYKLEQQKTENEFEHKGETYGEKSKNNCDNAGLSTVNTPLSENKIITISDESTEIKSQLLTQVKDRIIIMADEGQDINGARSITMELNPQELGKLDIKLIYENKRLTVEIKASNEEIQKILSSNCAELKVLLNKTSQADVEVNVKAYVDPKYQQLFNYQNEQGQDLFYQNYDHSPNHQGRQKNKYYYEPDIKKKEEDLFADLMGLNYSKIKEG